MTKGMETEMSEELGPVSPSLRAKKGQSTQVAET